MSFENKTKNQLGRSVTFRLWTLGKLPTALCLSCLICKMGIIIAHTVKMK